jgi:nucleotide-binding universal stress UspA family protein
MVEHIIVATDFSTRSDRAIRRATLIAGTTGARLSLVHVVDSDQSQWMIDAERDAARATLHETVETIEKADGVSASSRVEVNDVVPGILEAADAVGAQLIVVGPHRKRLNDIFVGTTAERVVRRSRLPLLVAVQTPSARHARTLLALDFDEASRAAARAAVELGVFEHTTVIAMHAFDTPARGMMERAMESADSIDHYVAVEERAGASRLQAFVAELGLPSAAERVVAVQGSPARSILETAVDEDADLVVLGARNRKGFERLLIGSVAENVLREAHRDILIVPVDESPAG